MAEHFDAATIENANRLLELFKDRREADYIKVMNEELTENEYKHNFHILMKNLREIAAPVAFGAVRGGTGIAKDELGLTGEQAQRAIRALKHNLRIQQCGRGRGKCIIILKTEPLLVPDEEGLLLADQDANIITDEVAVQNAADNFAVADDVQDEEMDAIDANNIPALLRRVRDHYRDREREIVEMQRKTKTLTDRITALEAQLVGKDEKIAELESKAHIKAVATWQ